jgi:hypothetical protein
MGVPCGRAIRFNLFLFKEKRKSISASIPNPKSHCTQNKNRHFFFKKDISYFTKFEGKNTNPTPYQQVTG